ncbi:S8 family peptidase [Halospina denitrificans]|nr:S8 family serine peptidase [Halospina denitrificans]
MDNQPGTLSGTIEISSGTRVDRDTALDLEIGGLDSSLSSPIEGVQNPSAPFPGNVIAGGYVSAYSGSYDAELDYPKDDRDTLRLQLSEGQRVSVNFFPALADSSGEFETEDAPQTKLTLTPVGNEANKVSSAEDRELNKSVQAPQNGEHDLVIRTTDGGPARYVLRSTSLSGNETLGQASADFEPGEAIITREAVESGGAIRAQASGSVELADQVASQKGLGGNQFQVTMPIEREAILPAGASNSRRKAQTLEWIRELNDTPGVASAVPNHRVRATQSTIDCATAEPDHPECQDQFGLQAWHYNLINTTGDSGAWSKAAGTNTRIAVLDTGVAWMDGDWHPDLAPNINCGEPGGCFDAVDGSLPIDEDGSHGTHVSGLAAAAATDDGDVTGVAHDAKLVPVRVLGGDEGTVADVIEGVRWVINNGNPHADVINLSLGSQTQNPTLGDVLAEATAAGILVVAASGNAGDDRQFFPAAFPSVLAVGAVDCEGNRSSFSNFGNWLDLVAPGGGNARACDSNGEADDSVFSSFPSGDPPVGGLEGTSMAAPHVAGVLGLMREVNPGVEMPIIRALLREGRLTQNNDAGTFDQELGRGIIDANASVTEDLSGFAALAPSLERLRLDDDRQTVDLSLDAVGNDSATFNEVTVTNGKQPWLVVEPADGERNFRVSLDTEEMDEGQFFRSAINVSYRVDNGETREYQIPVTATLEANESDRNAGAHFVQLVPVDAANDGSVSENTVQTLVEARNGQYRFKFDTSEMEPGEYLLIAGSDLDNDGAFCGAGEACAEFPVTGQPRPIEITRNMSRSVELETAFTRPFDSQGGGVVPVGGYPRLNQDEME